MKFLKSKKKTLARIVVLMLALNLFYATKSLSGLDIDPEGHHGDWFPLGNWLYETFRYHPPLLSFAGRYVPIENGKKDEKVSGFISEGWWDNSDWGDVKIEYKRVPLDPRLGTFAQRIEVKHLGPRSACQIAQAVSVTPGHLYRATVKVRSDAGLQIELVLREGPKPYRVIGASTAKLGPNWTEITTTGIPLKSDIDHGKIFLMLRDTEIGSFEVASATLRELKY